MDEIESVIHRRVTDDADLVAVIPIYAKDGRCEDIIAFCDVGFIAEDEIKQASAASFLPACICFRAASSTSTEFPRSTNDTKIDYRLLTRHLSWTGCPAPTAETK